LWQKWTLTVDYVDRNFFNTTFSHLGVMIWRERKMSWLA
jgi:hypothetical protein